MLEFMDLNGITVDATNRQNVSYHYHFHYQLEFLIVWSGTVRARISGNEYILHRGDISFALPFEPHSYITEEDSISGCFVFAPEIVSSFYKIIHFKKVHKNAFKLDPNLFNYIEQVFCQNHLYTLKISNTEKIGILYLLLSQVEHNCPNLDNSSSGNADLCDITLKYLSQHFLEPISLESVARSLGYNKSYLSRRIKEQSGKGFAHHLISLRIFHAVHLIEQAADTNREISFSEIALECGFNNIRSFNRCFKIIVNDTPSKYLLNHKKHKHQWC